MKTFHLQSPNPHHPTTPLARTEHPAISGRLPGETPAESGRPEESQAGFGVLGGAGVGEGLISKSRRSLAMTWSIFRHHSLVGISASDDAEEVSGFVEPALDGADDALAMVVARWHTLGVTERVAVAAGEGAGLTVAVLESGRRVLIG